MKKRFYIFTFIAVLGFLLIPSKSFACENETSKSCCDSEIKSENTEKDCCGNTKSENENKNCGGKCEHSKCCTTTTLVFFGTIPSFELKFVNHNFNFSIKKQNFYNPKSLVSKGFSSIWLPPAIY
jgi:hypothetical protein